MTDMWRRQQEQVILIFAYPPEVRMIIYTTNALESSTCSCVRSSKRGYFPSDEAASKLPTPYAEILSNRPSAHGIPDTSGRPTVA